jgi:hypothetical protein
MPQSQQEKEQGLSKTIFNISRDGFQELQRVGLTLDQLFYLECCKWNVDLKDIVGPDKFITWRQSLVRKGFLTEDCKPSTDGLAVLEAVGSGQPFRGSLERKHLEVEEEFEKWWQTYPSTDIFEYKGKRFEGTRSLKRLKAACRDMFVKILKEGQYTAEDLIRSLEYEVYLKKELSLQKRDNQVRYMPNTHAYLNQRAFEGLVEASKEAVIHSYQSNEDI